MTRLGLWAVVIAAGLAAVLSYRARVADGGTPGWDSSSHGLQGVAIAQDIARFDIGDLIPDVFGHRYHYPPGHPVLLAGGFLLFGTSWWTAIGLSAILFAGLALVLYSTAESTFSGWLTALLALTCPALLALSGMIMLEIPAAILVTLALHLYARSLTDDSAVRPLGWTLTVFMVTAAQYAACTLVILMAFELWRGRSYFRDVLVRFVRSRSLFHPMHILVAIAVLVAIAIRVTGGWSIPVGSRTLSMTRAGGPLIAGALLIGLRVAWVVWKRRPDVPRRYRDIFFTGIVPIYLWVFVLYPPRFQQFAEWVSRPPTVHARTDPAHWSFYPAYFLEGGHAHVAIAIVVVLLVAASFIRRRAPERVRFLQWAALAGAGLVLLHHARQSRFIVPFLPAWWMLAAEALESFMPTRRLRAIAVSVATIGLAVAAAHLYGPRLATASSPPPIHREYAKVLKWAVDQIDHAPSLRVIGGIDGLSRHLFEWELRRRFDVRDWKLRYNLDLPERVEGGPRRVYDEWIERNPEDKVVTVEPLDLVLRPPRPIGEIRKSDHDWPEFTMRFLWDEPRYEMIAERSFEMAQLRIRVYRKVSATPRSSRQAGS